MPFKTIKDFSALKPRSDKEETKLNKQRLVQAKRELRKAIQRRDHHVAGINVDGLSEAGKDNRVRLANDANTLIDELTTEISLLISELK